MLPSVSVDLFECDSNSLFISQAKTLTGNTPTAVLQSVKNVPEPAPYHIVNQGRYQPLLCTSNTVLSLKDRYIFKIKRVLDRVPLRYQMTYRPVPKPGVGDSWSKEQL